MIVFSGFIIFIVVFLSYNYSALRKKVKIRVYAVISAAGKQDSSGWLTGISVSVSLLRASRLKAGSPSIKYCRFPAFQNGLLSRRPLSRDERKEIMMQYTSHYESPLGAMLLAADDEGMTGLWFEGQKYFARLLAPAHKEMDNPILREAKRWLVVYFSGRKPDFQVPIQMNGTAFQKEVWDILLTIPYGQTMTYGAIAGRIAEKHGLSRMSSQAVGGAVGHNEISILIPCHRVVGTNGSLTGYAGGIDKKIQLLKLEKADMSHFFIPKKGTAL